MATKRRKGIAYTQQVADYILEELEKGRTLISICKENKMPTHSTVHKWVRDDIGHTTNKDGSTKEEGFASGYKQARETQLNFYIDQMHDIADAPPPVPPQFVENEHGEMILLEGVDRKLWVNAENMRRRLKVDAIKFQAGKLAGVMGHNSQIGVSIHGDTINIINYATEAPQVVEDSPQTEVVVKTVNFIDTSKVNK